MASFLFSRETSSSLSTNQQPQKHATVFRLVEYSVHTQQQRIYHALHFATRSRFVPEPSTWPLVLETTSAFSPPNDEGLPPDDEKTYSRTNPVDILNRIDFSLREEIPPLCVITKLQGPCSHYARESICSVSSTVDYHRTLPLR